MNKDILQKFITYNGDYLVGNRRIEWYREQKNEFEAIFLSPDVSREYWVEDIGKLPFDDVEKFLNEEIKTIIHLGKSYGPFQYGIRRKDFVNLEKVTCNSMDLIAACYEKGINNYYEVIKLMEELTNKESPKVEQEKE